MLSGLLGLLGSCFLHLSGVVQCLAPFLTVQGLSYNAVGAAGKALAECRRPSLSLQHICGLYLALLFGGH